MYRTTTSFCSRDYISVRDDSGRVDNIVTDDDIKYTNKVKSDCC